MGASLRLSAMQADLPRTDSQISDLESSQLAAPAPSSPGLGMMQRIFGWFGTFKARKTLRESLNRQVKESANYTAKCRANLIMARLDQQAAEIRRKVELTQARLE